MAKHNVIFAGCATAIMLLSSCSAMMEARPVCTAPNDPNNGRLAPMYQCIEKMTGRKIINSA